MQTNFSEESKSLLLQAKKASIGRLKPAIVEELMFYAFVELQHPLWLIIQNKYKIDENVIKNTISNDLLKNGSDDPENPANIEKQNVFFEIANQEAIKDESSLIEPLHLFKAVFLTWDNCVIRFFKEAGISIEQLLEDLGKLSYSDLANAIQKASDHKAYAPSRRVIQSTEQYSFGLDLNRFGRNLNDLAKDGKLDPVFFRDEEIQTTLEILCRKQQNNPLLIGEAGVGKTAIAEGIAQLIVAGHAPSIMSDKQIIELSITSLVAGTTLRGQFEENVQRIINECQQNPNIILFIDEIHMIVGAGGEKGLGDAANIFKPALARGSLRCMGATTLKESRQFIDKDRALARRFQPVFIKEPTVAQTIDILNKCKERLETFHQVKITDEAIKASVELAEEHIKNRYFPGKAIDLLDHACAREKIDPNSDKIITKEEIAVIVAKDAQVPITQLLVDSAKELTLLQDRLRQRVIDQEEAIKDLVGVIQLTKMGMDINQDRPEGVFLFVGATGVGKTTLAKSLTMALLGDETRLVNFNMTEFKDATSINRFIGAAPGYIGFDQESKLANCVRSNPNSIILLDEIEKAHPDILTLLKGVFEKGTLVCQDGDPVYFSHAIFILTSNIGADVLREEELQALNQEKLDHRVRGILEQEVKNRFTPEFLNAIDKVIYFNAISRECMKKIVGDKIETILMRLKTRGFEIKMDENVGSFLLEKGYSIRFGAKFIDKVIEDYLLKPLTQYILSCGKVMISASLSKENKLFFNCE
ncbi:MAG: ATP-dependent Clp protease ATP-binding subunit [Candidatus Omnitrophica bacterium]|nr:ATP-dependent Clp protease ATP-binding subunit [Candidatus Omnitrophota bacterium]